MVKINDVKPKEVKSNKNNEEDLVIRIGDFLINHSILSYKSSIRLTYEETILYSKRLLAKISYENNVKIPDEVLQEALDIVDHYSYINFENSNPVTILKEAIKKVCGGLDFQTALSLVKLRIKEGLANNDPVLGRSLYQIGK